MKRLASLSALPLALALFGPRALDTASMDSMSLDIPVPAPPTTPPGIIITSFTRSVWGGSGCRPRNTPSEGRTQSFRIGADGRLEYAFTSLRAATRPELREEGAVEEAECLVLVEIAGIPPGWAFRVTDVWATGYASMDPGTAVRVNTSLSLGGPGDLMGAVELANPGPADGEPVSSRFMAQMVEVEPWQAARAATPCVVDGPGLATVNLTLSLEANSEVVPVEEGAVGVETVYVAGALRECQFSVDGWIPIEE